jgi:hypothetical protein
MRLFLCIAAAVLAAVLPSPAQYRYFAPQGGFAVEVSLENSPYLRLPIYRNAITSLEVVGDFAIGGTSADAGLSPYLFAVSISRRRLEAVFPVDQAVPGQQSIPGGFGRGPDGALYAGTIAQSKGDSGHLLRVQVNGGRLDVTDLGMPVPSEGVFAVTADPKAGAVYGISYPTGKFFVFHIADRKTDLYEQTALDRQMLMRLKEYVVKPDDVLSRRLVVDAGGRVYGSCPLNRVFRFDPATKKVEFLESELPDVAGRRALGRVDSWAIAPDGTIYGGAAADGELFRLDPATGKIANLGKPAMMPRMKGIAFGRDGQLYGVTGASPGYAHAFTYDLKSGFTDFGNPVVSMKAEGIEQGIPWRAFQIGTVAASEDGSYIVMGEEESLSQLIIFPVTGATGR